MSYSVASERMKPIENLDFRFIFVFQSNGIGSNTNTQSVEKANAAC
jgi:hypothetical protein